jgi:hypothetical protein
MVSPTAGGNPRDGGFTVHASRSISTKARDKQRISADVICRREILDHVIALNEQHFAPIAA